MTAVFVFGHDRSHFYRIGHHDWLSSHGLALAANFSPDHAFLLFDNQTLDPEMDSGYKLYNRYPPGAFALTALAIAPFDGFASQILAARMLMLLFFAAAAAAAYLALRRLFDPWAALSAVLLSCSSWYALYYNDMISCNVPSLFGVLLAFHGMVVFVQEGRFRQLVVKSCAALLLGWQVYALLLPFIAFGAVDAMRRHTPWGSLREAGRAAAAVLCGRHVTLGVVTLLFGVLVLGFNLANEYRAFDGELPLTEVPTFKRMLWRFGLTPQPGAYAPYADSLAWWPYLRQQAASIGGMSLPFLVAGRIDLSSPAWLMAVGAGACAAVLIAARRRPLLAVLAVSGLCWTIPMRHYVFMHDYQSLFYIGIPLVLWSAVLSPLLGRSPLRCATVVAVTLVVFLGSTVRMSRVGHGPVRADWHREVIADFKAIRLLTAGKGVFVPKAHDSLDAVVHIKRDAIAIALAAHGINYYLTGSRIDYQDNADRRPLADFILTNRREPGREDALLTPDTRRVFLYDRAALDGPAGSPPRRNLDLRTVVRRAIPEAVARIVETNDPILRARFDLYVTDDTLVLVKDRCTAADVRRPFMGKATPTRESDLHEGRQPYGFNGFDLSFERHGAFDGDRCWLWRPWPSYGIRRLEFGQYIPGIGDTWRAATSLDIPPRPSVEPPRPSVELIGAPTTLAEGAQVRVAVQAVNLDPARQHLIRVVYNDHLGARSDCTRRVADRTSAVFSGRTSHTESFAVHGCAPGNGTITAGLRLIADGVEEDPPIAIAPTVSVTVTSQEAPGRRDGEVAATSLDIPPRPSVELIDAPPALEGGAQARVAVQAVNLDPARQHLIRVQYNDHLGARSDCTRRVADRTSAVFSGRTSHTESFAVHGCAPGNGTITAGLRLIAEGVEEDPPIAIAPTVSVTVTSQEAPGRRDGEVEAGSDTEARTPGDIEN